MPELADAALIGKVSDRLRNLGLMLATAESCTGGLIAAGITARAGSSEIFERGFVTYSNDSKTELLGVPAEVLHGHGAVSAQVCIAMARGALAHSRADLALSVTGIAGPGGGSPDKPVGLVYIGYGQRGQDMIHSAEHRFSGSRDDIRRQTADAALKHILKFMDSMA